VPAPDKGDRSACNPIRLHAYVALLIAVSTAVASGRAAGARRTSAASSNIFKREKNMPAGNLLYYALVALVIALIAGFLGFGGIAGTATGIAQLLFYVFIVVFLVVLVMNFIGRGRGPIA
jgi:uncharacterized membrane protein YtjA (UPF0391 family)